VRRSTVRLPAARHRSSRRRPRLTNHHCVSACIAELSSAEHNRLRDGFLADSRAQELRCSKQTADVLMEIEDITSRVAAATAGMDPKAAGDERRKALTRLEQGVRTGGRQDRSPSLQRGEALPGRPVLPLQVRRYDDVRLVFAPEAGIAQFGGDPTTSSSRAGTST